MSIEMNVIIIPIIAIGIILFNVGLIYALLSGSAQQQLEMFRRIARQARRPWASENESLDELRQRVQQLVDNGESETPDG